MNNETNQKRPCMDDSCDATHCHVCGGHMIGWYLSPGAICSMCEMLPEEERAAKIMSVRAIYAQAAEAEDAALPAWCEPGMETH